MKNKVQNKKNNNSKIFKYSKMSKDEILKSFNNNINTGYSTSYAEEILEENGENKVGIENEEKWYNLFLKSYFDPFSIVLFIIVIISIFTDIIFVEESSFIKIDILLSIIFVSGTIHFVQDLRAKKSVAKLKEMVSNTTAVVRDEVLEEIPITDIVVGDIIKLSAGDIIPADLRIIESKDLFLSQSSLTGESEPIEKFNENEEQTKDIFDLENICFMGTNIVSGSATGVVIATGKDTYIGQMSQVMSGKKIETAFDKGIKKVTSLLIKITIIMVPIVFLINIITKGDVLDSFIYAIAIAVGITPELLIVIVTSNLAKGSIEMAKKKTIIKDLNTIQNFGAMDILCTDKTGTLTQDHIVLQQYLDVHGNPDIRILRHAFLNSHFQTGLKNLLDIAIIEKAKENDLSGILENYKKIDEIPFDFARRRMSIVIEDRKKKVQLITKGAVQEILSICKFIETKDGVEKIDAEIHDEILQISNKLNTEGLRVVAIAQKNENIHDIETFGVQDENEMVLIRLCSIFRSAKR